MPKCGAAWCVEKHTELTFSIQAFLIQLKGEQRWSDRSRHTCGYWQVTKTRQLTANTANGNVFHTCHHVHKPILLLLLLLLLLLFTCLGPRKGDLQSWHWGHCMIRYLEQSVVMEEWFYFWYILKGFRWSKDEYDKSTFRFNFMVFACIYCITVTFYRNGCFCVEFPHFQLCKNVLLDEWMNQSNFYFFCKAPKCNNYINYPLTWNILIFFGNCSHFQLIIVSSPDSSSASKIAQ